GRVHLYNNYTRWRWCGACTPSARASKRRSSPVQHLRGRREGYGVRIHAGEEGGPGRRGGSGRKGTPSSTARCMPCLVNNGADVFRPEDYYQQWTMEPPSPELKDLLQQLCSGWQPVPRPPDQHC